VFDLAYGDLGDGSLIPVAIGATIAEAAETGKGDDPTDWRKLTVAIATGVAVSVGTSLLLDWVNGKGLWEGTGSVVARWKKTTAHVAETSAFTFPSLI